MAGNRLAQILEREYQSQGLIGGFGSAIGKRMREKVDIRNAMFGGSGLSAIVGRKIFGKGYSATSSSNKSDKLESAMSSKLTEQSEDIKALTTTSRITAKNTLALPSMARDMYLVKQNIIKLVKLNKGKPQTKAGDWMSRQKARESAFGSFSEGPSKKPTKTEVDKSSGGLMGFLSGIFDFIGPGKMVGILAGVAGLAVAFVGLKKTIEIITDLATKLYNWVAGTEIGRALGLKQTESAGAPSGGGEGGRSLKNPFDVNWKNVGEKTADVGKNAVGVGVDVMGRKIGKAIKPDARYKLTTGSTFKDLSTGKYVKASQIAGDGKLGKILERLRKFAVEAASKKWGNRIVAKLSMKLGAAVAAKVATMLASLAAAPFSAGTSLLITIVSTVWLLKDIYDIYDAIFGEPGGIYYELTEEDKAAGASTTPTKAQEDLAAHQKKIEELKEKVKTEKAPIAKANMESEIKYHQRKIDEAKASGVTEFKANSPTTGGDYNAQIAGHESGGNYNAVFGQPEGVNLNGIPLSENSIGAVAAWQAKHRANKTNRQAAGKYQFMDVMSAAKLAGLTYKDKFSPENQEKMMQAYTAQNAADLKAMGIDPTKENLSLAHMVGASGAAKLIAEQKSGNGGKNAAQVLGLSGSKLTTNPHLNKSASQVIADAGARVNGAPAGSGTPSGAPNVSIDGNALASVGAGANPLAEMLGMMGEMLNDYHKATKGETQAANFDSGTLETYNEDFMKKLLGIQSFQPNKA